MAYKQKIRTGSPTLPPVFEDQFASVFAIAANGNTARTTSEFDFIFKAKDVPEQLVLRTSTTRLVDYPEFTLHRVIDISGRQSFLSI